MVAQRTLLVGFFSTRIKSLGHQGCISQMTLFMSVRHCYFFGCYPKFFIHCAVSEYLLILLLPTNQTKVLFCSGCDNVLNTHSFPISETQYIECYPAQHAIDYSFVSGGCFIVGVLFCCFSDFLEFINLCN